MNIGSFDKGLGVYDLLHKGYFCQKYDRVMDRDVFYSYYDSYKTCIFNTENIINYYECQIVSDSGEARIGFGASLSDLLGPLGIDKHGYSIGSKNGYGFHDSVKYNFGISFKKNDIVSCVIHQERFLLFFINGKSTNMCFKLKPSVKYFPAFSLYNECEISFNFNNYFAFKDHIEKEISKFTL